MKKKGCNPEKLGEKPGVGRQGQDAPWYYESLWGGGRSKKRPQGSLTSNFGHISDHGAPTNWFCSSLWHPCFFTDSSTAWYINQHKSTFTPCFIHRKKNSLSLSLSLSTTCGTGFYLAPCKLLVHIFQLPELPLHLRQRGHFFWDGAETQRMLRNFLPLSEVFNSLTRGGWSVFGWELKTLFEISHCHRYIKGESTIFQRVHCLLYTLFLLFHPFTTS